MRLLSDKIAEFISWMELNTDFGSWDPKVKEEVHKKLITCMISDPIKCWHGHTERQVGCVSCVLVFDRPAEIHSSGLVEPRTGAGSLD